MVHNEKFKLEEKAYKEVKDHFILNYMTLHPIISQRAIYMEEVTKNLNFHKYKDDKAKIPSMKMISTLKSRKSGMDLSDLIKYKKSSS